MSCYIELRIGSKERYAGTCADANAGWQSMILYIYILYINYYIIILYHIYYILYIVYTYIYIYIYLKYHEYIIGEPKAPAPQAPG